MRIEWLPIAERNRASQLAYIADRNTWAAIDMGDAIEIAVRRLADHPQVGRSGRVEGTRELVISGTPYVIAHRVETDAVVILRLLHGAQRWPIQLQNIKAKRICRPPTSRFLLSYAHAEGGCKCGVRDGVFPGDRTAGGPARNQHHAS